MHPLSAVLQPLQHARVTQLQPLVLWSCRVSNVLGSRQEHCGSVRVVSACLPAAGIQHKNKAPEVQLA